MSVLTFAATAVAANDDQAVAFVTKSRAADQVSEKTTLLQIIHNEKNKTISAVCSDGKTRVCRYDRLPDVHVARQLWRDLKKAGQEKQEIQFVAAGGFNPDRWFYTVK